VWRVLAAVVFIGFMPWLEREGSSLLWQLLPPFAMTVYRGKLPRQFAANSPFCPVFRYHIYKPTKM
jgi:hypothetical protein